LHEADRTFSTWKPESEISRLRRHEIGLERLSDDVLEVLDACRFAKEATHGWFDPWALEGGVDPTGFVKGWAAERALAELAGMRATGAIVNAAGDVGVLGGPAVGERFRVGIVNPFERSSLSCVVEVASALATSGDYERGSHLVDPFAGVARTSVASASVCGPDLGLADALATALAVGGDAVYDVVEALKEYDALIIKRDRTWRMTSGFPVVSKVDVQG
jgi:thiamine biosynthesis lipoprotein